MAAKLMATDNYGFPQAYGDGYAAWCPNAPAPHCPYEGGAADLWWRGWEQAQADAHRIAEPDDA